MESDLAKSSQNLDILGRIYNCIDNTTLSGADSKVQIDLLCSNCLSMCSKLGGRQQVAAVCVYPVFVRRAKLLLADSAIRVASVAGAFPSGQSPLSIKLQEVKYAVDEGADEIDMVISRGALLEGDVQRVFDEIASIREVTGRNTLKVILETGELQTSENIRKASEIAIAAGADFIKTSTGKIAVGATIDAAKIMLQVIGEHFQNTGKMVGFKAAGGISTAKDALVYYSIGSTVLGRQWMDKKFFRFGVSRLGNSLMSAIEQNTVSYF